MDRTLPLLFVAGFILFMAINMAWQHYHCGTPWQATDLMQMQPCEPIDQITAQMEYFRLMAQLHPYCEKKRDR